VNLRWRRWVAAAHAVDGAHKRRPAGPHRPVLAAALVCLAHLASAPTAAGACELLLSEHRSEKPLLRLALNAAAPVLSLHFVHSVLGTSVQDHYRWRGGAWHLTEETFSGAGYGLPHEAAAGETLVQRQDGSSVLQLNRMVSPLVVRPVQGMQLQVAEQRIGLRSLSALAIELRTQGCEGPSR
jgi:hypothetical protein